MNKTINALVLAASTVSFSSIALAYDGQSTLSAGFAQSHAKYDGYKLSDEPRGINIKLNYEIENGFGVITSLTHTRKSYDGAYVSSDSNTILKYTSITVGPSYRLNEYFSGYGLVGWANGKASTYTSSADGRSYYSERANNVALGFGMQTNITHNIVVDTAWEFSKLDDFKAKTWVVGLGYSF